MNAEISRQPNPLFPTPPFTDRAEAAQFASNVLWTFIKSVHAGGGPRAQIIEEILARDAVMPKAVVMAKAA